MGSGAMGALRPLGGRARPVPTTFSVAKGHASSRPIPLSSSSGM